MQYGNLKICWPIVYLFDNRLRESKQSYQIYNRVCIFNDWLCENYSNCCAEYVIRQSYCEKWVTEVYLDRSSDDEKKSADSLKSVFIDKITNVSRLNFFVVKFARIQKFIKQNAYYRIAMKSCERI